MSHATPTVDFAEQQRAARAVLASAFPPPGAEAVLSAQAEFLVRIEATLTNWLQRRHAAVQETRQTVERIRHSNDILEIWQAQQAWLSAALQRLSADAEAARALAFFPGAANANQPAAGETRKVAVVETASQAA
jgi:hypothetical protein